MYILKRNIIVLGVFYCLFIQAQSLANDIAIPEPPQSKLINTYPIRLGGADIIFTTYQSQQPEEKIIKYYQDFFKVQQFQEVTGKETDATKKILWFKKDSLLAQIVLANNDDMTQITTARCILPQGVEAPEELKPTWPEMMSMFMPKEDSKGEDLTFVPRPPDSIRIGSINNKDGGCVINYTSSWLPEDVKGFYLMEMDNRGWTLKDDKSMDKVKAEYLALLGKKNLDMEFPIPDISLDKLINGGSALVFNSDTGELIISVMNKGVSDRDNQGSLVQIKYKENSPDNSGQKK